jgi:hypothetical protein
VRFLSIASLIHSLSDCCVLVCTVVRLCVVFAWCLRLLVPVACGFAFVSVLVLDFEFCRDEEFAEWDRDFTGCDWSDSCLIRGLGLL